LARRVSGRSRSPTSSYGAPTRQHRAATSLTPNLPTPTALLRGTSSIRHIRSPLIGRTAHHQRAETVTRSCPRPATVCGSRQSCGADDIACGRLALHNRRTPMQRRDGDLSGWPHRLTRTERRRRRQETTQTPAGTQPELRSPRVRPTIRTRKRRSQIAANRRWCYFCGAV
jgi:hypothetical protein